jgi:starch-binding outer membrane protein SusE/F
MKNILYILSAAAVLLGGCKKTDFEGNNPTGEGLVDFTLITPTSGSSLKLNAATPNATVGFSWNAARPGLITAPTYKIVAALKTGGDLANPLVQFDVPGSVSSFALTQKQIDDALKAKSIADGATTEFIWGVSAENGSVKILSQSTFNITITRMKDGASPFKLLAPSSSTTANEIDPTTTAQSFLFRWTKSLPAAGGPAVSYKVLFSTSTDFKTPLFSINGNASPADTTATISYKALSDSLDAHGLSDLSQVANLKWTVIATSGTWKQQADYINDFAVTRLVRMFMVGDITGWDINNPFELVADKGNGRLGKVFYTYVKVTTTAQFLFIKEKGNWGSKYGITGGAAPTYDIGYNTGGDFFITTPGIYRLTIDAGNLKAHIQAKQVGLVGQFQGWNPSAQVNGGYIARDKFIILQSINLSDEFKFHDGPVWDNSSPDKARWWGKGAVGGTLDTDGNGANLMNETGTAGLVRCIWDGTDPQKVKYGMTKGQLRVVGSLAVIGSWNPDNALDMTYMGNGVWQKTVTFSAAAEFKFVSASGWDLNYGDAGAGKIVEGGGNLNRAAGTYTITVDEYNRTFTVL